MKIFRVTPGNFGDDLNEILIEKRLGAHFNGNVFLSQKCDYQVNQEDQVIVAIGTILNNLTPKSGHKIVLGAGTGYGDPVVIDQDWDVRFVRGPLTAKKLGLPASKSITDPAILLADTVYPRPERADDIGYIPHHAVANSLWQEVIENMGLKYIDPRRDFDSVMGDMVACKWVIAEAMHGAIVADALRIPWVPVASAEKINTFKWHDWCSTIGIEYSPVSLTSLWPTTSPSVAKKVSNGIKKTLVTRQLNKLLKHAQPQLSSESIFKDNLLRVSDCYDEFFAELDG
ncbi:polysaccharide pyruvyl transferase family protein [Vibrio eleionomae]|uniref:polysaccharide pyruvyl transferase family protein n=1 Tax=Vibrio eleionomae TaxID=2653505 RepID=UPI0013710C9C